MRNERPPSGSAFETAVELLSSGVVLFDLDGTYRYLNPVARDRLRAAAPDRFGSGLVGRRWQDVYPHLLDSPFARAFRKAAEEREAAAVESFRSDFSGRTWWVALRPLPGEGVLMEMRDTTEEHRLGEQMALIKREFPFGAVVTLDRDLRYQTVGGRGLGDVGVVPEDVEGLTIWEAWPPEVAGLVEPIFREALRGKIAQGRIPFRSHEYILWAGPLRNTVGDVIRILGITWDVSEHAEVAKNLDVINAAVGALHVGLSIADARRDDHPMIYVNDAFLELTGYEREEVLGRNCRFLQCPETRPEPVAEMRRAVKEGRAVQVALRNARKSGERFWNRVSIYPIRNEEGVLTHFVGIQEDVTEQRRMGEALQLKERLSAVGQLAGGVAHDIRNVLMGVGGILELDLERPDLPEDLRADLDEARRVLGRAVSVADRLLVYARDTPIRVEAIELNELVRERCDFLGSLIRDDIEIVVRPAPEPAWIRSDPGQMDQVLINLATNAQDAMPEGGRLAFSVATGPDARPEEEPQEPEDVDEQVSWVRLTVEDEGTGMDPDTARRAAEPFFTTKQAGGGTGLGLSTVFGVVSQAGGQMKIESAEGEGTRIHLFLPRIQPPVPEEERTAPEPTSKATILLAEDDPTVRRTCARALEGMGHIVHAEEDGAAALDLFRARPDEIDLVVTDMTMPRMDGRALVREIRVLRPELPVIVMTGWVAEAPEGSDPVDWVLLEKPFELATLHARVEEALASGGHDTGAGGPSAPS